MRKNLSLFTLFLSLSFKAEMRQLITPGFSLGYSVLNLSLAVVLKGRGLDVRWNNVLKSLPLHHFENTPDNLVMGVRVEVRICILEISQ